MNDSTDDLQVRAPGFAIVPNALMDQFPEPNILAVYLWLYRHGNGSKDGCWASVTTIAAESGVGINSVRKAIQSLTSSGWIEVVERPGYTSLYYVRVEPSSNPSRNREDYPSRNHEGSPHEFVRRTRTPEQDPSKTPVCPQLPGLADAAETAAQPVGKPRKRRKLTGADVGPSTFAEFGQEAATVLLDWWHNHKGGAKTDLALQLQMGELRQIQAMGGNALVQSQAELAIRSGVMRGKGWSQINAAKCRDYGSGNHARQPHGGQQAVLPSQELLDIASLAEAHPRLFSSAVVTGGAVELTYTALVRARFGYPEKSRVTMEEAIKAEVEALENRLQAEAEQAAVTPF